MTGIDKNRPTQAWIEELRRRYPCEKEIDRVLTRKMQRRAGPQYSPVSLETLVKGTEALIRSEVKDNGISQASAALRRRWCCAWSRRNRLSKPAGCANSR